MKPHKPYFGLLQRRELLLPTWPGLLLLALLFTGFMLITVLNVQSFLTLTEPVKAKILVVEGWVPDYVLEEAMSEFELGHYSKLYVTGGPIERGLAMSRFKTFAEHGATMLIKMGLSASDVEAVPAPKVQRDRTYVSALALKSRLQGLGAGVKSMNLVSEGVHARRSRLLFEKAFDHDISVGIIAIEDRNYVNEHWWKYSDGVRSVIDELFAYLYALLVFPFVEP